MAKGRATQVVQAELADEDVAKIDAVTAAVQAVEAAVVENSPDAAAQDLIADALTLDGTAQALVAESTPCRGVLLRAPAASEPTDPGPNAAAFFAGPTDYPTAFRIATTQYEGLFIAIDDAAKLRVKGTLNDQVKFVIFSKNDGGVQELVSDCLTLDGNAQALVDVATPCRGVMLRAPASDEPTDAGPNAAALFAGPVSYPTAFRVGLTQIEGVFISINDASKLRVKGTASDKVKYTIFAL